MPVGRPIHRLTAWHNAAEMRIAANKTTEHPVLDAAREAVRARDAAGVAGAAAEIVDIWTLGRANQGAPGIGRLRSFSRAIALSQEVRTAIFQRL